ncbi:nitroreductase family protein [Ktedonobacter robiniae]|uniref:Oxidoreductase n=1 Tax=Ktedonobacter robiniae TaxID=2778365 RepID=A0ABQ3UYP2_9CHLR|nr:nitroreductase family protein [Ktedonobacter robiniae]GHO57913.1 oxidoreductase [Ktedonobacter robiniae]
MPLLHLTSDELLTTTRTVRKRLDLSRPVEPEVLKECLEIALQAPSGSNRQDWHFLVIRDESRRRALAELYWRSYQQYLASPGAVNKLFADDPQRYLTQQRIMNSTAYLVEHIHNVPVHLIPCVNGRMEGLSSGDQASRWASILPATWSFMLAARARGLGAAWTTFHLDYEEEAAEILGIPYHQVTQAALLPVAYTLGTNFKPAPRASVENVIHWDQW